MGGCEVISTEDALANLEDISSSMKGWTSSSWWDGLKDGAYEACGKCSSMKEYEWSKEDPAWCRCADVCIELLDEIIGVVCERLREVQTLPKGDITKEVDRSDEADPEVGGGGRVVVRKCTYDYMRTLRRLRWEEEMDWDIEDEGRVVDSTEVLPEDLQDYTVPMVIIGSDVVSLYPNLDVDLVVDRIRDEVLRTDLRFMNVDYLEATRYLVLNWSEEECRMSSLRRVLPHRRGRRGTRPGMRGAGPRGKQRGDQEQWEFRNDIILEEGEKKQILAEVIKLAVLAMFKKHYYSFGGKKYNQKGGGPIGLRGTCAVARVIMQLYDRKWGELLEGLCVKTYGTLRYMDDMRTLLPPFRAGWRWVEGKISYCVKWEREDEKISGLERTRRILGGLMGTIEPFLRFTTETEEDFPDSWLPTLDTAIRISEDNRVLFKFWEKPTNSNRTLDRRTAMGENQRVQILTQEVIRRLGNTIEGLPYEEYQCMIDNFCQKLCNSGYGEEQMRKIVVAGIRGWGAKITRCETEGRRVRRTARDSLELRMRTKLTGKRTWFKKKKVKKDW